MFYLYSLEPIDLHKVRLFYTLVIQVRYSDKTSGLKGDYKKGEGSKGKVEVTGKG